MEAESELDRCERGPGEVTCPRSHRAEGFKEPCLWASSLTQSRFSPFHWDGSSTEESWRVSLAGDGEVGGRGQEALRPLAEPLPGTSQRKGHGGHGGHTKVPVRMQKVPNFFSLD